MNLLERYNDFVEKVQAFYKTNRVTYNTLKKYCENTHKDFESLSVNKERNYVIINFKKDECSR